MKNGILRQSSDLRHEQLLEHEREFLSQRIKILELRLSVLNRAQHRTANRRFLTRTIH